MRILSILLAVARSATASLCDAVDRTYYNQISGDQVTKIKQCLKDGRYATPEPATYGGCMSAVQLTAANLKDNCKTCMANTLYDIMDCEELCTKETDKWLCVACRSAPKFEKGVDLCWAPIDPSSACQASDELRMMSMSQSSVKASKDCLEALAVPVSEEQYRSCLKSNGVENLGAPCLKCTVESSNQIRACQTSCAGADASAPSNECQRCIFAVSSSFEKGQCNVHTSTSANTAGDFVRVYMVIALVTLMLVI